MTSPGLANAHARHIKSDCLPSVSGKGVIWWKLLPAFCFCWPSWECCSLLSCREDKDVRILYTISRSHVRAVYGAGTTLYAFRPPVSDEVRQPDHRDRADLGHF